LVAVPSIGRAAQPTPQHAAPEADATRRLYEQYARQIYAYCLHQLRNKEEAEDATQSTFLNAFRGLQRGIDPEFESAWLYKIAQNVCLTRQRSSTRRRRLESPGDLDAMQDLLPSHESDNDALIRLPEALEEMPEQQRRALLLREWQGLSYREIADELRLSQSAVETLLFRARRSLAAALTDESKPGATRLSKLRAGGDAGSLLALAKTLAFSGGTKVAVTVATVAASSVVASTPAVQHATESLFVPSHGRPAARHALARHVQNLSLLFHAGPAVALAATRPRSRSGKLVAEVSRAAHNARLARIAGAPVAAHADRPAAGGGHSVVIALPTTPAPATPTVTDVPTVAAPTGTAPPDPVATDQAASNPAAPAPTLPAVAAPPPAPAPTPASPPSSGGPQAVTPPAAATAVPLAATGKTARQATKADQKTARQAVKEAAKDHGKKGDGPTLAPVLDPVPAAASVVPATPSLPPAAVAPPQADVQPVLPMTVPAPPAAGPDLVAATQTAPVPAAEGGPDPGADHSSDHGGQNSHGQGIGHRK
jgi:RNA polymerase sigma-70 factor (ECF subfamily)